jgi:predicted DsbA family dithiol-disulfide isomerase
VQVEIWSDVVCPWCYIGKRRFESALARFPQRAQVEVTWRSFELNPSAPAQETRSQVDRLAAKYGISREQALANNARLVRLAAAEGLTFDFEAARSGNTLNAHRLLHLAAERGVQDQVHERLFAAYFSEGEPIGDPETLVRLVAEAGLEADAARAVLGSDAYLEAVRADEAEAAALGISGVPCFVLDRRYGVTGAQPAEVLLQALEQAWSAAHPAPKLAPVGGDGPTCDDDTCAI